MTREGGGGYFLKRCNAGRGALPSRNIQQGVLPPYPLPLASKTGKVLHQSTKSCGPGIILRADKCSGNITATNDLKNLHCV